MKSSTVILFTALIFTLPAANSAWAKETAQAAITTHKPALHNQWAPENLSGKIAAVDVGKSIVVVHDPSGTPFDFVVTPSTKIKSGTERLKLSDLASKTNDKVSVRYIPERSGDIARLVEIGQ